MIKSAAKKAGGSGVKPNHAASGVNGIAMPVTGLVWQLLAKVYGVHDDALR